MSLMRRTSFSKSLRFTVRTMMPSRWRIFSATRATFSGGGTEEDSSQAQRSFALAKPQASYSAG